MSGKTHMTPGRHHLGYHFHRHHWNIEVVEYYAYQTLYQIAYATLSLYLPIYLLNLGYALREVVLWFVINELWFVLFTPFSGRIIQALGLKRSIALKLPALALFFFFVQRLSGDFRMDLPFLAAILAMRAFAKSPADMAEDLFYAKYVLKKAEGKIIASVKILMVAAGIASPLVGGVITYFFGFDALFTSGLILILISAIPLFLTPDRHFRCSYTSVDITRFPLRKLKRSYLVAEIAAGLPDTLMWIMWPLFMYFVVKNTADIGALVSGSMLLSIVVSYYIGKRVDERDPRGLLKTGVRSSTGFFLLRALALHPLGIALIDACSQIMGPFLDIPYTYYMYRYIKRQPNQLEIVNVKQFVGEVICFAGTLLILGLVWLVPNPGAGTFIALFVGFSLLLPFMGRIAELEEPAPPAAIPAGKPALAKPRRGPVATKPKEQRPAVRA
jgi:hypothetical protein